MYNSFTYEDHHVETIFLENELGINCCYCPRDSNDLISEYQIIVASDLSLYKKFIRKNSKKKLLLIHLSAERILWRNIFFYFRFRKNTLVLRNYLGKNQNWKSIVSQVSTYFSLITPRQIHYFIYHIGLGIITYIKVKTVSKFLNNVYYLPLGYTNNFHKFIFSNSVCLPINKFDEKLWAKFIGIRGNLSREIAFKSIDISEIDTRYIDKWGGNSYHLTENYVNNLVQSNLSFCPPGFRSNESFRFFESIYLGNFSVSLAISLNCFIISEYFEIFTINNYSCTKDIIDIIDSNQIKELVLYQNFILGKSIDYIQKLIFNYLAE